MPANTATRAPASIIDAQPRDVRLRIAVAETQGARWDVGLQILGADQSTDLRVAGIPVRLDPTMPQDAVDLVSGGQRLRMVVNPDA